MTTGNASGSAMPRLRNSKQSAVATEASNSTIPHETPAHRSSTSFKLRQATTRTLSAANCRCSSGAQRGCFSKTTAVGAVEGENVEEENAEEFADTGQSHFRRLTIEF
jgi:hypothetical protein